MTKGKIDSMLDDLDALLDSERRALVSGNLDELSQLHDRKEELISALNALDRLEADALTSIRNKMSRNQALLSSAMEGIRAVADRMAELRRVRQNLSTYDRDGKRHQIATSTEQKLEKRA